MALFALILEQPFTMRISGASLMATLFIGLFSTGLAYLLLFHLIAVAGAVFTSTFSYFMPFFALLASHFLIDEPLDWKHAAGIVITLAGAWLINRNTEKPSGVSPDPRA